MKESLNIKQSLIDMTLNDESVNVPLFNEWLWIRCKKWKYCLEDNYNLYWRIMFWLSIINRLWKWCCCIVVELDAFVLHVLNAAQRHALFFGSYCTIIIYWCYWYVLLEFLLVYDAILIQHISVLALFLFGDGSKSLEN